MVNNIICICYYNVYVIISLFLFLREFTRIKWSENENGRRERWRVEREESLSLSFSKGWLVCRRNVIS